MACRAPNPDNNFDDNIIEPVFVVPRESWAEGCFLAQMVAQFTNYSCSESSIGYLKRCLNDPVCSPPESQGPLCQSSTLSTLRRWHFTLPLSPVRSCCSLFLASSRHSTDGLSRESQPALLLKGRMSGQIGKRGNDEKGLPPKGAAQHPDNTS